MPYKDKEKAAEAQRRYEEKRKGTRFSCWTLIFYEDSAPPTWRDEVSDVHLPVWVSPLHDRDTWTAADEKKDARHVAGTPKKAHRHLICQYPQPVDRDTFLSDFAFLNGSTFVKNVRDLTAMVRYLIHKDDPQKAQYDRADVVVFGSAELDAIDAAGTGERHEMLRQMRRFIRANAIVDYCVFADYCDECEAAWARLLDDNSSYVIERYIASQRAMLRDKLQGKEAGPCGPFFDPDTGEVKGEPQE